MVEIQHDEILDILSVLQTQNVTFWNLHSWLESKMQLNARLVPCTLFGLKLCHEPLNRQEQGQPNILSLHISNILYCI
jgi:hypothetical protein